MLTAYSCLAHYWIINELLIKAVDDYYSGLYGSYVEGEEKGIAKGRAEGELSKSLTIARNLLAMGMTLPQIMKATGLNEEQLKQL